MLKTSDYLQINECDHSNKFHITFSFVYDRPSTIPRISYIGLILPGRANPTGSLSAQQQALSWLTSAAWPGASQNGL